VGAFSALPRLSSKASSTRQRKRWDALHAQVSRKHIALMSRSSESWQQAVRTIDTSQDMAMRMKGARRVIFTDSE
jgi:hypothetical protein